MPGSEINFTHRMRPTYMERPQLLRLRLSPLGHLGNLPAGVGGAAISSHSSSSTLTAKAVPNAMILIGADN